jgi:hypothetical protein
MFVILALILPAQALGQGAGDEQYRDPFADQQPNGSQPQQQGGSTGQPAGDPAVAAQGTTEGTDVAAGQTQPGGQLPRTGFEGVFLLLGYGWALLVGGAALRRIA